MSKRPHDRSVNLRQTLMSTYISPKSDQNNSPKKQKSKKIEDQKAHSSQKPKIKDSKKLNNTSKKPDRKVAGMSNNTWAYKDTEEYRDGYPNKKDNPQWDDNYRFYMNEIPSKPDGDYIDNIHKNWWGDYKRLEIHHGYIQWLFPIRDTGMNWHAQELQLHEIEKLKGKENFKQRIIKSYKMMLDFYGMKLIDETDGTIARAENWKERFCHLNRSFHNYLRITRILKSLGEFGFEKLKANFVEFILYEGLQTRKLSNLIDSCLQYWIGVLKDDQQRNEMLEYYKELWQKEPVENLSSSSTSSESGEEAYNNIIDEVVNDNENNTYSKKMPFVDGDKDRGEESCAEHKNNENKDSKLDGEIQMSHCNDVMPNYENDTLSYEYDRASEQENRGDDLKITKSQISETKDESIEKEDGNATPIVKVNEEINDENIHNCDGKDKETNNKMCDTSSDIEKVNEFMKSIISEIPQENNRANRDNVAENKSIDNGSDAVNNKTVKQKQIMNEDGNEIDYKQQVENTSKNKKVLRMTLLKL